MLCTRRVSAVQAGLELDMVGARRLRDILFSDSLDDLGLCIFRGLKLTPLKSAGGATIR